MKCKSFLVYICLWGFAPYPTKGAAFGIPCVKLFPLLILQ